jgi:pyruvate formate lyase activating enzyme
VREASFYEKLGENKVHCGLCRHHCVVADGRRGICGVRENRGGTLYTLVYGLPCSYHIDPIEKKPLFHFFPGSRAFSIATVGCNFRCRHCQNHEISQMPRHDGRVPGTRMTPEDVVALAEQGECRSISYTYTEPTMFFEYAYDIARLAQDKGLYNSFVTNGYIEEAPLKTIQPYLHGANIDLKGFDDDFYKKTCGADLQNVLAAIRSYKALHIWIELTTLVIPGYNDKEEEFRGIAQFIKHELGPETPWHVSAFYPTYKLTNAPPTPPATLERAREIGLEQGLLYVYEGNVPGSEGENTFCYSCKRVVIERRGYTVTAYNVKESACAFCGAPIHGVGM